MAPHPDSLPGFAGRTIVEALETRGDSFPYGSSVTPSRTTRNADALWSISHDAVCGGDGATVDASSPVLTVFVDATEAAATNATTGITLEAGPRVGPNAVEAILCSGTVEVTAQNRRRATPRPRTPHPGHPIPPPTVHPAPRRHTMHHLRLHQPIPPADPPHDSVVPQRPDRPREPHHPVLVPPPGRDPRPRPPHRPHLPTPTKTTPQPTHPRTTPPGHTEVRVDPSSPLPRSGRGASTGRQAGAQRRGLPAWRPPHT